MQTLSVDLEACPTDGSHKYDTRCMKAELSDLVLLLEKPEGVGEGRNPWPFCALEEIPVSP